MNARVSSLPAAGAPRATPESPWLGLHPFTENEHEYFFGRSAELTELYGRVTSRTLTVFFGTSGLGKTSLVQAALVPRLRDTGFVPVLVRLDHNADAPPLEKQVLRHLSDAGLHEEATSLWLLFHDPKYGLCGTVHNPPKVVLIIDQFEEIFTLGQLPERNRLSREFLAILAEIVENRVPQAVRDDAEANEELSDRLDYSARAARVLLTMREDYLHELERSRTAMPSMMDNRMELRLLNGRQAFQATVEPGKIRQRGHDDASKPPPIISDETGLAIVRFVAKAEANTPLEEIDAVPPLLSLLCAELNAARGGAPQIQQEQLQGRAEDVLSNFYERCFERHPPVVRRFVEGRLLSPDGYRQSVNSDTFVHELEAAGIGKNDATGTIRRLINDRLLVSEDRSGVARVEFTHDILTRVARQSRDRWEAGQARKRRVRWVVGIVTAFGVFGVGGWMMFEDYSRDAATTAARTALENVTSDAAARSLINPKQLGQRNAESLFEEYWRRRPEVLESHSSVLWERGCLDFSVLVGTLAAAKRGTVSTLVQDHAKRHAGTLLGSFRFEDDTGTIANETCPARATIATWFERLGGGAVVALAKTPRDGATDTFQLHRWSCQGEACSHVRVPVNGTLAAASGPVVIVVQGKLLAAYPALFDEKQSPSAQLKVPTACAEVKALRLRQLDDRWVLAVGCSAPATAPVPVLVWSLPIDASKWEEADEPLSLPHGQVGSPQARVQALSIGTDGSVAVATDRGLYIWAPSQSGRPAPVRVNEGKVVSSVVWHGEGTTTAVCAGVASSSLECRGWNGNRVSPPVVHAGDYEPIDSRSGQLLLRTFTALGARFGVWSGSVLDPSAKAPALTWVDALSPHARLTKDGILVSDQWAIRERSPGAAPSPNESVQAAWQRIQRVTALSTDDDEGAIVPLQGAPRSALGKQEARTEWLSSTRSEPSSAGQN